jgi:hypothetical protein
VGARGWAQGAPDISQPKTEIDARFDYIPSVNQQYRKVTGTIENTYNLVRDEFEQPRRALAELRQAVTIKLIAVHRRVNQGSRAQAACQLASYF